MEIPHGNPSPRPPSLRGRYGEATAALTRIDGIAVGRADRGRIEKDVMARRGLAATSGSMIIGDISINYR